MRDLEFQLCFCCFSGGRERRRRGRLLLLLLLLLLTLVVTLAPSRRRQPGVTSPSQLPLHRRQRHRQRVLLRLRPSRVSSSLTVSVSSGGVIAVSGGSGGGDSGGGGSGGGGSGGGGGCGGQGGTEPLPPAYGVERGEDLSDISASGGYQIRPRRRRSRSCRRRLLPWRRPP
jgi:hypothetical protein